MSKRIANCKGRTTEHFGRIRISWRKLKMMQQLDDLTEAYETGDMDEKAESMFQDFKHRVKQVVSKKLIHRHQGR